MGFSTPKNAPIGLWKQPPPRPDACPANVFGAYLGEAEAWESGASNGQCVHFQMIGKATIDQFVQLFDIHYSMESCS